MQSNMTNACGTIDRNYVTEFAPSPSFVDELWVRAHQHISATDWKGNTHNIMVDSRVDQRDPTPPAMFSFCERAPLDELAQRLHAFLTSPNDKLFPASVTMAMRALSAQVRSTEQKKSLYLVWQPFSLLGQLSYVTLYPKCIVMETLTLLPAGPIESVLVL